MSGDIKAMVHALLNPPDGTPSEALVDLLEAVLISGQKMVTVGYSQPGAGRELLEHARLLWNAVSPDDLGTCKLGSDPVGQYRRGFRRGTLRGSAPSAGVSLAFDRGVEDGRTALKAGLAAFLRADRRLTERGPDPQPEAPTEPGEPEPSEPKTGRRMKIMHLRVLDVFAQRWAAWKGRTEPSAVLSVPEVADVLKLPGSNAGLTPKVDEAVSNLRRRGLLKVVDREARTSELDPDAYEAWLRTTAKKSRPTWQEVASVLEAYTGLDITTEDEAREAAAIILAEVKKARQEREPGGRGDRALFPPMMHVIRLVIFAGLLSDDAKEVAAA